MSSAELTFERPFRPIGVRLFNAVANFAKRLGCSRPFTVDEILRGARRATGLQDFGDDDFLVPLQLLVDDYQNSAQLHPFGKVCVRSLLQSAAENRLLLHAAWKRHPEYLDVPLQRPLYVVGMPRTGTTLLYNLLCQDPDARPLMVWETMYPARNEKEDRTDNNVPRQRRAKMIVDITNRLAPSLRSVHAIEPNSPEEDGWLMNNTFVSLMFILNGYIPNYSAYLRDLSHAERLKAYQYYAQELQLLQAGETDRHWVLKSPVHQPTLSALLETVPTACVVQTHRDPRRVIASCCSLLSITRGILSDHQDLRQSGREFAERMAYATRCAAEARLRHSSRICDVTFENLVSNPIATVRRIYERFGYAYSLEMETGMRTWLAKNPQHKHGAHRYQLEQFGITEGDIDRIFADYTPVLTQVRAAAS